jgi:hypothetical protein
MKSRDARLTSAPNRSLDEDTSVNAQMAGDAAPERNAGFVMRPSVLALGLMRARVRNGIAPRRAQFASGFGRSCT